jgi:hypothetical protein
MMCIGWRSKSSCYEGPLPQYCPTNPWFLVLLALAAIDLLRGGKGKKA